MKRRRLLGSLAAGASLLAGCVGSTPDDAGRGTGGGPTPSTADTATPTTSSTDVTRSLSVEEVVNVTASVSHALRLNDLGRSPSGEVPSLSELSDRRRRVVETALGGTYRTDDLPGWLAEFAGSTPFVRADGTLYRLRDSFPTYTITAETVSKSEVSGEIAGTEAYHEAVTHDGVVTTGLIRIARRDGMELTYVWSKLREFVDRYEAVRYRGELVSLSIDAEDPGTPYTLTAERATPGDLTRDSVWNATDAPTRIREVIRAAGETGGVYRVEDPPERLLEKLRANDYVYLDGHFYTTYVEARDRVPVSMTAQFTDATLDGDGATLSLSLHNDHDGPVSVTSGAPPPFGVLRYHPEGGGGGDRLLWSDAYDDSDHVHTEGHDVRAVNDIAIEKEIPPGESVGETFRIEDRGLPPGTYVVEGSVGVVLGEDQDGGSYDYRVVFTVE